VRDGGENLLIYRLIPPFLMWLGYSMSLVIKRILTISDIKVE
jgi:hypothetical protein